ncbi:hypothetical protein V500_10332 [Pseudogymnoascus sp. VKM F-4518 (FW-2643)]|nr:hypothetical protein V500_10332 [Pseudogymnoascus sp. VKM F-4518 (FW-2643)]
MAFLKTLLRSIRLRPRSTNSAGGDMSPILSPDENKGLQTGKEPDPLLPRKKKRKLQAWFQPGKKCPANEDQHREAEEARERKAEARRVEKERRKAEARHKAEARRKAGERRRAGKRRRAETTRTAGRRRKSGRGVWQDSHYHQLGLMGWPMGHNPLYQPGLFGDAFYGLTGLSDSDSDSDSYSDSE